MNTVTCTKCAKSFYAIGNNVACPTCGFPYVLPIAQPIQKYDTVEFPSGKGYQRNGSPFFYKLLEQMAETHDKKSHDYASNSSPFDNYKFAGMMSKVFNNPDDSGFIGRIGEKVYRLANLENSNKIALNETIEDTEIDICTIIVLWMAMRHERRINAHKSESPSLKSQAIRAEE